MDTSEKIVKATQKDGALVGPSGAKLTLGTSMTPEHRRPLKNAVEGNTFMVKVVGLEVVALVKDDEKDKLDSKEATKTAEIEEFRKLLRGKVVAKIREGTTYHELPDGEDRIKHFFRMVAGKKEEIVSASFPKFQIRMPSKIIVTGFWDVSDDKLLLTITHYGEGSLY